MISPATQKNKTDYPNFIRGFLSVLVYGFLLLGAQVHSAEAQTAPTSYVGARLLWPSGIEPGDPSICEAPVGKTCYWVDCDAGTDGAGTHASPFWGFETVFGYFSGGSFVQGSAVGGDVVYVKGTCEVAGSVDSATGPYKQIRIARQAQLGTIAEPLIIKSWRGTTQATFDGEFLSALSPQLDVENAPDILVKIEPNTITSVRAVRVQNLRFTRAMEAGMRVGYLAPMAYMDLVSLTFDDNFISNSGTNSPLVVDATDSTYGQEIWVRNSRFVNNYRNCAADGVTTGDTTCTAGTNDGALDIYSGNGATPTNSVYVVNNFFDNNTKHYREKHNGSATKLVAGNWFGSSEGEALYVRQTDLTVRHNIFDSNQRKGAILTGEAPPAGKSRILRFYNNSGTNVTQLIEGTEIYRSSVAQEIYNNAFDNLARTDRFYNMGANSGDTFDPAAVTMDSNYFRISGTTNTSFSCLSPVIAAGACTIRTFAATLTYLNATTTLNSDPQFVNIAGDDFSLAVGSPARTAGRSGGYLGAIAPSSSSTGSAGLLLLGVN